MKLRLTPVRRVLEWKQSLGLLQEGVMWQVYILRWADGTPQVLPMMWKTARGP